MPTPKPIPLPTPGDVDSLSRVSNEPSPGSLNNDNEGGGAESQVLSPNNLDEENGDDGVYARGTVEELLHPLRQSISPFEEVEGDEDINLSLERREKNRNGNDDEAGESHKDELGQVDRVLGITAAKTSLRKRSGRPDLEKSRGPSRTALRPRSLCAMSTRASRQVMSSQPRELSRPRIDSAPRPCSSRTTSPGTELRHRTDINYGPSASISYQVTDLTLYHVTKGSSIVAATVRCNDPKLPLNLIVLDHELLGGKGKVIRMTQLSPDSWMLLGYRHDDSESSTSTRESTTLNNTDWVSSPRSNAASHDTNHSNNGDKEYEEDLGNSKVYTNKSDIRCRQRTRGPWLESGEERFLSYKDKTSMEWKDICGRFPDRSPGAVKLRYYTLRKKDS